MPATAGPFLMVNLERCIGCHTCELACSVAHTPSGTLFGAILNNEALFPRNRVIQVEEVKLPTQCRQCEDAPCVRVCPTGATFRTDTYIAVNTNLCIACKLCMMVCPFGAIQTAELQMGEKSKRAAIKCDLCVDRLNGPACVEECPTKAITLVYPKEVMEAANRSASVRYLDAVKSQIALEKQS
jgi:Fe-S-cluster-containing hydrogenase component 2